MFKKPLKIVYGYSCFPSIAYGNVEKLTQDYIDRLNGYGFDVAPFCLTINPPAQCLTFKQLDRMWKWGDRALFSMYEKLERFLEDKDVLINASGINLHPEFIKQLDILTVFQCFDDPENSDNLSRPAAGAYDICFVGNIAEVDTYKKWGIKNVYWTTLYFTKENYNPLLTYDKIISGERDIDLFMMIDRLSPWRKKRMDQMLHAFPDAHFYGNGWPRGYLPISSQVNYLSRAKLGPNIHNSTGPINIRTFYLPANGVLQICDNKSYLSKIFILNKEIIGFDSIDECIDLCRYYLSHDSERREIAANGWLRVMKDYNEKAVFQRIVDSISQHILTNNITSQKHSQISVNTYKSRFINVVFYYLFLKPLIDLKRILKINFLNSSKFILKVIKIIK